MPYSAAQNRATQKYSAKAYDQIKINVKKGKRAEYNAYAAAQTKSLNALIVELLERDMQENGGK